MRVYSEESFGPLASIVVVDGVEQAIEVANDTEYGLAAAVFSANVPAALELAQRIQSGICHINDATVHDEPQMPFGGVKDSGWGRFGGRRRARGVHRAALDHDPGKRAPLPDLSALAAARERRPCAVTGAGAARPQGGPGVPSAPVATLPVGGAPPDGRRTLSAALALALVALAIPAAAYAAVT